LHCKITLVEFSSFGNSIFQVRFGFNSKGLHSVRRSICPVVVLGGKGVRVSTPFII
jgi:hypothetical protein